MTQIKDKVVWITGASAGIGKATAEQMALKGARLVLSARRKDKLEELKSSLALSEEDVLVLPMDMKDLSSFESAYDTVKRKFGKVDILFNNAGISQRGSVIESTDQVYHELMDVNYWAPVKLTKIVLSDMIAAKSGHFMVTSSLSGKFGSPMRSGYCASKHALHGFYDSLRTEVFKYNIKVTIICPGYINTDISKNALAPDGQKHGKMDTNQEQGLSVQKCASQIVKAVEKNKTEVYMGGKEVFGVYLKRFLPSVLEKILIGQAPK
ncbi:Short-chain dehydrogenase [Spirosomataceae bacterium TFI 002]|nr:Short-chain dehydrogenase [Spirosomataceae bacterium TFI 002]